MSKPMKIILAVAAAIAALAVILAILAVVFFPAEKFRALAETTAGNALGMPVHIGHVGLSFAGIPAVKISGISAGTETDGEKPLVAVESVRVRVNLLKLLKKEVEIVLVEVNSPSVTMITRADGSTNGPPKKPKTEKAPGTSTAANVSLPIPVSLKTLAVKHGTVTLDKSALTGSVMDVSGLDVTIGLTITGNPATFTSKGKMTIDDIVMTDTKKNTSIKGIRPAFNYELNGSTADGSVSLTKGDLEVNGIPVSITATVKDWARAEFNVSVDKLDIEKVLKAAPQGIIPDSDKLSAEGSFSLSVKGTADMSGEKPAISYMGSLDTDIARLAFKGLPKSVDKASGHFTFTEKTLDITSLDASIGASAFSLSGKVDDYTGDPSVSLTTNGSIVLDDVKGAVPMPEGVDVGGKITFDISMKGKPSEPAGFTAGGGMKVEKVTAVLPKVFVNPAEFNGAVSFTPSAVKVENLTMNSGKSDFRFDGLVTNYMTLAGLGKEDALFKGTVQSSFVDFQNLIVTDPNTTVKPWDLEEPLKNAPIPPKLSGDLTLALNTVTFGKLKADKVTGKILFHDGIVELKGLDITAYSGSLTGSTMISLANPDSVTYGGEFALKSLDSAQFIADFLGAGDVFRGKLSSSLSFSGAGLDSTSMLNNLKATGDMELLNGQLVNWDFMKKLGEKLPFLAFDTLDFDSIKNTFRVEDRKFITPDMAVVTKNGDMLVNGYTGFNKAIDYDITVDLDRATSKKALSTLSSLTKYIDTVPERLEMNVTAKGTLTSPSFVLDTSAAEEVLMKSLTGRASDGLNKLLDSKDAKDLEKKGKKLLDSLKLK